MNKNEFIEFLKQKAEERPYGTHWSKVATNSDDFWKLYKPGVDWVEDTMDLKVEGVVEINYNISLYDGSCKVFKTSYDDFKENYEGSLR